MIQFILSDIEGTTTSVSFVYDVLFPYFTKHLQNFVAQHPSNAEVQHVLKAVKETVYSEEDRKLSNSEAVEQLLHWTQTDRKHTALKNIQGQVWREAYEKGEIKGHVYPDVPPALEKWKSQGIQLGVYSSGSVAAQKLIFSHTNYGDLSTYFSHHYDTNIGHKREAPSYQAIQKDLSIPAENILFLSDVEAELDAAQKASFQTLQLVREGTIASTKHDTRSTFETINPLNY